MIGSLPPLPPSATGAKSQKRATETPKKIEQKQSCHRSTGKTGATNRASDAKKVVETVAGAANPYGTSVYVARFWLLALVAAGGNGGRAATAPTPRRGG